MSLSDKIKKDVDQALKDKDKSRLKTLRYLYAQIKDKEIDQQREKLTDKEVLAVVAKQLKELKESLQFFEKEKREDLIKGVKKEVEILKDYLPEQMPDQELEKEVEKIIKDNPGISQPGPLIGKAVAKLGGKADNNKIAQLIKEKFAKRA